VAPPSPPTSPTGRPATDSLPRDGAEEADPLLRAFLKDRDAPCPQCGYNLRGLTRARCPECRELIGLTVALQRVRLGWLAVSLVPGAFSGVAALLLLIPIVGATIVWGQGPPPWPILAVDAFGWLSGLFAIVLFRWRESFLCLPRERQRAWALIMWAIHIGMFILFIATVWLLF
jgi:hypothetical protein